jgi:hypothetical protein
METDRDVEKDPQQVQQEKDPQQVQQELEKEEQRYKVGAAISIGGALLLFVSLFMTWYQLDVAGGGENVPTYNAFELLERTDIYIVILCALAPAVAAAGYLPALRRFGLGQWGLTAVGALAALLVIYRGSERPKLLVFGQQLDTTLEYGWYISLLAGIAMAAGGVWALSGRPRRPPSDEDEFGDEEPESGAAPPRAESPGTEEPRAEPPRTEEPSR